MFVLNFYMPLGQVDISNYLPCLQFYLPQVGMQCLMLSPGKPIMGGCPDITEIVLTGHCRHRFHHYLSLKMFHPYYFNLVLVPLRYVLHIACYLGGGGCLLVNVRHMYIVSILVDSIVVQVVVTIKA